MSKQKQKTEASSQPMTLEGAVSQLVAIERGLGLTEAGLSRKSRVTNRTRSEHVPDELIELLAAHSDSNGGVVAGTPFDAAAARATLTQVSAARRTAASARRLAQRVEDDATSQRANLSDVAFGIYRGLERLVRTPQGSDLQDTYDKMRAAVRASRKGARKAKASSSPPAVTPPATQPQPQQQSAGPTPASALTHAT